jgi:ribonuclease HI
MKVYTDASRDDEIAGMGWQIVFDDGDIMEGQRYVEGSYTSMEAEYFAMLDGLRMARRYGDEVEVYVDCDPLVRKMETPDGTSEDWYQRRRGCLRLLRKFESWSLEWKPRESNAAADRLAYEALENGRENMA